MTPDPQTLVLSHEVARLESGLGYLSFLDHIVVDAQPKKLPWRHIAQKWQQERAIRSAGAVDQLADLKDDYQGPRAFWEGWHKGSDKSHDNARQLCFLLAFSRRRLHCYVCAGKEDQAALLTTAMQGVVQDNQWLEDYLEVTKLSASSKVNGSQLTVLPMNSYTGQGIFPDFVIASEVTHWQYDDGKKFWEFILESVNKRPQCVLKVETNAGLKGTWQWDERNRVSKSRFWSFHEAPVGPPLATWMDQAKIDDDSQGLSPGERDRLYKNRWVDPGEEHGYLSLEDALRCQDPTLRERAKGERGQMYFAVIDYGGVYDRCALSIMHVPPGTQECIVDRMDCWQGSHSERVPILMEPGDGESYVRSVELWLEVMRANFFISALVIDPFQLESIGIRYEKKGMRVLRFMYRGGKANHRLAQMLKTAVQNRMIRWSPEAGKLPESYMDRGILRRIEDQTIEQEMAMIITKPMVYGYRIDHESGRHDDRCLVGETLVDTLRGPVEMRDVMVGDQVLTRYGYREVLWAGVTKFDFVRTVKFSDGSSLTGSGDHPVWTNEGWVPLDRLNESHTVYTWSKQSNTTAAPTAVTPTPSVGTTESTSSVTTSGRERCGTSTDQFQRGITFTTRTTIPSTTSCPTSNVSADPITPPCITTPTSPSGESGSRPRPDESTLESVVIVSGQSSPILPDMSSESNRSRTRGRIGRSLMSPARYAVLPSAPRSRDEPNTAPTPAVSRPTTNETPTRYDEPVSSAEKTFTPTSTDRPLLVGVGVLRASASPRLLRTLYDITVAGDHEFFANGILVHNCVNLGMGLLHAFPEGVPFGPLGPTSVPADQKVHPLGSVRTATDLAQNTGLGKAMDNWNLFGNRGGGGSDWDRGEI